MHLNTLKPTNRNPSKRVGRGIGSGLGKTCGRGHKGQKSRSGGFHKIGFEGGQMPLQRRLPKSGFSSRKSRVTDEIRLHELNGLTDEVITLEVLKKAGLINSSISRVKVFASGKLEKKVALSGIQVTKGAREAIEAVGGKVEA